MTDLDFNQWNIELTAPSLQGCQRLGDFLPVDLQAEFRNYSGLSPEFLSYTWLLKKHYDNVARWAKAVVLAGRAQKKTAFFVKAILETYNYDRALRAAEALGTQPILRKDIPDRLTKTAPLAPFKDGNHYVLVRKKFDWDRDTPAEAVDAVALVMEKEIPDKLWIAEYVEENKAANTWDPIIYARYGDWHVEVARWE